MSIIQNAIKWAVGIASDSSHGYDQAYRWGPNYDCSSLVISAYEQAGARVKTAGATYTGNMRKAFIAKGFKDVTAKVNRSNGAGMRPGDVLLHERNHTAMHIGNGQIVQASGNERGGITGGQTGDQTGGEIHVRNYYNYPWDCVLRLEEGKTSPAITTGLYTVQPGEGFWIIAEKTLGDPGRWRELAKYNGLSESHTLHPGDVLMIPGVEQAEKLQESATGETCVVTLPWLKPGDTGAAVAAMQDLLKASAYSLDVYGSDGEWGDETSAAVDLFHAENQITEDGCGPNTWAELIGTI